jgi:hypothetical protein
MSRSELTNGLPRGVELGRTAKRPYQKPAVRYQRVFETTALTCGKVQTTQSGCHYNRRTS